VSLRDQLLKAGVVSKKDVRRAEQDLKTERRQTQGHKRPLSEVRKEEEAKRAEAEEAARREKLEERARREAAKAEREHLWRVRQIVDKNAIRSRGKIRYHFRKADGHIGRIEVSDAVAWKLRCGEAAIALRPRAFEGEEERLLVVSAAAARRLAEVAPQNLVHHVNDTSALSAREEAFLVPDWEISLRPHRITRP
jgi:uncharacterized protein